MDIDEQRSAVLKTVSNGRVATVAQLERRGLGQALRALELPQLTLSVRVRSNDRSSLRDVTFLAATSKALTQPPRTLTHKAAITELELKLDLLDAAPGKPQVRPPPVTKGRHCRTDGMMHTDRTDGTAQKSALEVDLGYNLARIQQKVASVGRDGRQNYDDYLLATTVHQRTTSVPEKLKSAAASGTPFGTLRSCTVVWVDFWSTKEPYLGRPRCYKDDQGFADLR